MKVLIFAPTYPPAVRGGGPTRSLEALVATAPATVSTRVIAWDSDLDGEPLAVERDVWLGNATRGVRFVSVRPIGRLIASYTWMRSARPDALYFNSFFNFPFSILPQLLVRFGQWRGAVRVLAPRGEFGAGALQRRSAKKRVFLAVFRALGLHRRLVWHATSEQEAEDIRRLWGTNAEVLVRPVDTLLSAVALRLQHPNSVPTFAFLGRIVEHKGLAIVLRALASIDDDIALDVYGSEEDQAYTTECRALADALPGNIRVRFLGLLPNPQVRATLSGYDALLMPTAGENFGHAIAESLSAGCPVVATPYTPWTTVLAEGGGRVVADRAVESWRRELQVLAGADTDARLQNRSDAADAYDRWRATPRPGHLFDTIRDRIGAARHRPDER
ncbi:glycosyltransferase [Leifsonia sp. NPDC058292]|uniref:glycosyltransferase n=1 Tax=Leifsonia sp. NPDC058292 TaxID=3346428 RepID=UPI0036DA47BA